MRATSKGMRSENDAMRSKPFDRTIFKSARISPKVFARRQAKHPTVRERRRLVNAVLFATRRVVNEIRWFFRSFCSKLEEFWMKARNPRGFSFWFFFFCPIRQNSSYVGIRLSVKPLWLTHFRFLGRSGTPKTAYFWNFMQVFCIKSGSYPSIFYLIPELNFTLSPAFLLYPWA